MATRIHKSNTGTTYTYRKPAKRDTSAKQGKRTIAANIHRTTLWGDERPAYLR